MRFEFFEGCTSTEEVKKKHRTYAKQLHPDVNKASNAEMVFKVMQAEYEYINTTEISFPLSNARVVTIEELFNKPAPSYQPDYSNLSTEEILHKRAEAFFNKQKAVDPANYNVIDLAITEYKELSKLLVFMNKLDDLQEEHFKYVTFKFGANVSAARVFYKNYINNKMGW